MLYFHWFKCPLLLGLHIGHCLAYISPLYWYFYQLVCQLIIFEFVLTITLGGYIKINLICVPKQYARKKQPDIFVLPANTGHILCIKWVVMGPKCTYCHTSFCHSLLLLLSFLFAFSFLYVKAIGHYFSSTCLDSALWTAKILMTDWIKCASLSSSNYSHLVE